jgi:diguanylate cyclase (GGDEF)-like protein
MEKNVTATQDPGTVQEAADSAAVVTAGESGEQTVQNTADPGNHEERRGKLKAEDCQAQGASRALPLYNLVMRLPGPKNFAVRAFMLSFITTLLPMFGLMGYVALNVELTPEMIATVSIVMITALLGSISTVIVLMAYVEPVNAITKAFKEFRSEDYIPELPEVVGNDEIGELMANTQGALKKLHNMLHNMHELSIRDELTGLYNRRFFVEQADMLLVRAIRFEEPLSLIFIDIDRFKEINDTFSQQLGDHAIKNIAAIITDCSRGSDLAARLDGDEFVIVFPKTPLSRARILCDRLRNAVEAHNWSALLPDFQVTLSMGVAQALETGTIESLMDRADANLRIAKQQGGNVIQA